MTMSKTVTVGKPVPAFSARATGDQTIRSSALKGRKVVIYFYPKDNTPGCTTEGSDFRDLYQDFQKADCEIFGVSKDSLKSHENFKAKLGFPFELLVDEDETLCRLFDVIKLKKMYGREFEGIERSTFLIDASGKLRQEWRKVKVAGHAEEVLAAARAL
jgi:thioredoxin-dependent peroxiredoxin